MSNSTNLEKLRNLRQTEERPAILRLDVRHVLFLGVLTHFVLGAAHVARNLQHHQTGRFEFEGLFLLGLPLAVGGVLLVVERFEPTTDDYWRVLLWAVGGTTASLLFTALFLLNLSFEQVTVGHLSFVLLLGADFGALVGAIGGVQEMRVRSTVRRAQRAETQAKLSEKHRQSLRFLNRMLRHHLLNGLSIVIGLSQHVSRESDEEYADELETITERSQEMVTYVEDIHTAITTLSEAFELSDVDLSELLEREVAAAEKLDDTVSITTDVPPDVHIEGTELLGRAFEHLLENAVVHNEADPKEVAVTLTETERSVHVEIRDNGTGMPTEKQEAYFARGGIGEKSLGEGLGLYFAESMVSLCEGTIWIEDNDPSGVRVHMEFPRPS